MFEDIMNINKDKIKELYKQKYSKADFTNVTVKVEETSEEFKVTVYDKDKNVLEKKIVSMET